MTAKSADLLTSASPDAMFSIDDLDAVTHCEAPVEYEFKMGGRPTGIFVSIYGLQAQRVQDEINRLIDDRNMRQQAAAAAAEAAGEKVAPITPMSEDVEFSRKAAAVKIAGWRGLKDEFTAANALRFCQRNQAFAAFVNEKAGALENFIPALSAKS